MSVQDKFSLKGKVAVITGGAGLLGPEIGTAFAEAGAQVVLVDRDESKGLKALKRVPKKLKSKVVFLSADVADKAAVQELFKQVTHSFKQVDILVNAAIGIGKNHFGPMENYSWDDWNHVMKITVGGTFLCSQTVAEIMKKQKSGVIINFGSIYGVVGADQRIYGDSGINSPAVYAASKGAIINLTRYLAVYLAPYGIRVNSVSPGGVWNNQPENFVKKYSERTPLGRMLKKEELPAAILFLASSASSHVTGHNLMVDGGWTAW